MIEGLIWECQNHFHKLTILGGFKKEFQIHIILPSSPVIWIFKKILPMHFQKKPYTFRTVFRFSPKRKNSRLFIPAGTRKVVDVGHFFWWPGGPTKFRWPRSKIKGAYNSDWGLARNGQNPGEVSENDPYLANGKLAFLVIFGQIFTFLVYFGAKPDQKAKGKRCLVGFLICGYQNFCSLPK